MLREGGAHLAELAAELLVTSCHRSCVTGGSVAAPCAPSISCALCALNWRWNARNHPDRFLCRCVRTLDQAGRSDHGLAHDFAPRHWGCGPRDVPRAELGLVRAWRPRGLLGVGRRRDRGAERVRGDQATPRQAHAATRRTLAPPVAAAPRCASPTRPVVCGSASTHRPRAGTTRG